MQTVELKVSDETAAHWGAFLATQSAHRLMESNLLGDWVLGAFMTEVERYLREGLPQGPSPRDAERREKEAAGARRKLTKPQKRVLPMFNENENQTLLEMARLLGMEPENLAPLVEAWVMGGFLAPGPQRDGQNTFILSPDWQEHNLFANRPSLNAPRLPHLMEQYNPRKKR